MWTVYTNDFRREDYFSTDIQRVFGAKKNVNCFSTYICCRCSSTKQLCLIVEDCAYSEKQCYLLEMKQITRWRHVSSLIIPFMAKKPYIEIVLIVTTLVTNEIKSRVNYVISMGIYEQTIWILPLFLGIWLHQDLCMRATTLGIEVLINQGRPCSKLKQNRSFKHYMHEQALNAKDINLHAFVQEDYKKT